MKYLVEEDAYSTQMASFSDQEFAWRRTADRFTMLWIYILFQSIFSYYSIIMIDMDVRFISTEVNELIGSCGVDAHRLSTVMYEFEGYKTR